MSMSFIRPPVSIGLTEARVRELIDEKAKKYIRSGSKDSLSSNADHNTEELKDQMRAQPALKQGAVLFVCSTHHLGCCHRGFPEFVR
jgi:hypothetical protein